jgi:hypothetical protein
MLPVSGAADFYRASRTERSKQRFLEESIFQQSGFQRHNYASVSHFVPSNNLTVNWGLTSLQRLFYFEIRFTACQGF